MRDISRRSLLAGIAAGVAARNTFAAGSKTLRRDVSPDVLATDELYWRSIAAQYDVTREVVQLENGNWGICTKPVMAAYEQHLQAVNRRNSFYVRREFAGDYERIRARIATVLGVDSDEIALTRGATEALQALIGGYNGLRPGDAVLYCDLDYDSMQSAMSRMGSVSRPRRRGCDTFVTCGPRSFATMDGWRS
jgi:aspartate/methionine/tyrosine aminotransferase